MTTIIDYDSATRITRRRSGWDGSVSASAGGSGSTSPRGVSASRRAATRSGSDRRSFAELVRDASDEQGGQSALSRWLTAHDCPASQQNISRWISGSTPDLDTMQQVTTLLGGNWESVLAAAGRIRGARLQLPIPVSVAERFTAKGSVDERVLAVAWEAAAAAFEAVVAGFTGSGRPRR